MAYYAPSIFDLMSPYSEYGPPAEHSNDLMDTPYPMPEELPLQTGGSYSIRQPSGMDSFTDRLVGTDRYGELDDQARRRALGQAMMSIGQSLTAATGAYINNDNSQFAQLLGQAVPRAYGAFEKRLEGEDEYRMKQKDDAFRDDQREYQREKMGEDREDRQRSDAERKAHMDAGVSAVGTAEKKLTEYASSLPKTPETEAVIADTKAHIDQMKRSVKLDVPLTPQQMAILERDFDDIRDLSPAHQQARMDRERADALYKAAKDAGRTVEEEVAVREQLAGIALRRSYVDLALAEQNKAIGGQRLEQEKLQTKFMQEGGQVPVGYVVNPTTGGLIPDKAYVKPPAPKIAPESPAMKRAKTNDDLVRVLARPDELVSEEALGSLQELGIPAVVDQPLSPEAHERLRSIWYAAPQSSPAAGGGPPPDNASMGAPVSDKATTWAKTKGYYKPDGSLDLERAAAELKNLGYS